MIQEPDVFTKGIFGSEAVIGETTEWGILDEEYVELLGEAGESRRITFRIQSPNYQISHNESVTIGNRSFKVRNIEPVDDGKYLDLILSENG